LVEVATLLPVIFFFSSVVLFGFSENNFRRSKRALCLVLFATVEPIVNGDTVTASEDVKTLECSVCLYMRKVKHASMSCLVFHLLQKHNITKESHECSRCEHENPDGNLLHNLEDNGTGKVYKQTHSIISFFAAKNRSVED
jgi:hypothetical protein